MTSELKLGAVDFQWALLAIVASLVSTRHSPIKVMLMAVNIAAWAVLHVEGETSV